ncbi:histone deacetylase (plasmid) [Sulfurimonas aquatica]|uniref:Histone deacetylase n=1 Tax=Sulfurimonas aquatica TaxID=2672570 RepID=A0A975B2V0_9BACT|nr:histone deacetylase [Sulfurimonas aquatica]QSZ43204.1 histone deacetylase [Sulfurimonas aquatica]
MSSVAFIYDPIFLEHDTSLSHPENANRLRSILRAIEPLREHLLFLKPSPAPLDIVMQVHPNYHIELIEEKSLSQEAIDSDTQVSSESYEAALMAVGAGKLAIDKIVSGEIQSAFCAVRPPGHHATATQAMGFCLFNNIAITARYAQFMGYEEVMIIDFDVHHGNGTQEIFYDDSNVFYFSTHEYPAYPGSGYIDECGIDEGKGYTHNFPLHSYSGDDDILPIYEEDLLDDIESFQPDIILVSAGYDLHAADPLAQLQVSTEGIKKIVESIMHCSDVPKVFMLEGGYNLNALGESVFETLETMISS